MSHPKCVLQKRLATFQIVDHAGQRRLKLLMRDRRLFERLLEVLEDVLTLGNAFTQSVEVVLLANSKHVRFVY